MKSIFKSKTFWANVLAAAGHFSGYVPANVLAVVVPVVNIVLRFVTSEPVTLLP